MYFSRIFKVKEGKLEKIKEWFNQIHNVRREEALATFEYEGVTRETFALFQGKDGNHYVIGVNEADTTYKPGDASVQINQEHSATMKDCLESITNPGEVLVDLSL